MPVQRVPRNVQQQQAPSAEEFQGDPADVRKLILLGVFGLLITFGSLGGALFLINRPTDVASYDDERGIPSARGLMLSLATGGKASAHKFDSAMARMCDQMGDRTGDSMATARCKKAARGAW